MLKKAPNFVFGRQNPQRSPEATPPVFSRLRPRWMAFLSILLILTVTAPFSEAQLDQLRKSKALEQQHTAETPMVEIPAGEFAMGLDGMQALEDERPQHRVWLQAFYIDLHEVTTAQYASFLSATNRAAPWQWDTVDLTRHRDRPVIGVDWSDADAYCRWRGKGFPPKRNGRSQPEERAEGCIPGATSLQTTVWRISHWVRGSVTVRF